MSIKVGSRVVDQRGDVGTIKGKESLPEVLNELYQKTATEYENARHGGNDHALYVYGAQLDILKIIAARVLDEKLPLP